MAPFCSCPASLVSRKFFAVGPGCAKCFFFLLRSVGRRDLSAGPEQKKKHHPGCFFFLLRPRRKAREGEAPLGAGTGPEQKKQHHPGCFDLLRPRGKAGEGEAPCRHGARAKKKKGCFFFCCGPGERHHPGCFFFLLRPRPDRGGVFFLLWPRPDAHSLTVGWGDFGKARVVFFFLLRPRRVFLDNSKKCLGYYIGSKKTRRGHSKKKTPLPSCEATAVPLPNFSKASALWCTV